MKRVPIEAEEPGVAPALLTGPAKLLVYVAAALLFAMMVHVCVDVFARLMKLPLIGTNELVAAYYMIAIVFLPLAYVAVTGANVTVDLFTGNLRGRSRHAAALLGDVLGVLVSALWLWQATRAALHSTRITERWVLGSGFVQVWPGKWILVLAVAVLLVAFVFLAARDLVRLLRPADAGGRAGGAEEVR